MMLKIKLLLFFFISLYSVINSQVNVERYRKSQDSLGFGGEGEIRFSVQAGNIDLQTIKTQLRVNYNGGDYYHFAVVSGDYSWQKRMQISNESLFHLRHVNTINQTLQVEFFAQTDYSNPRKLVIRQIAGTGLRIRILKVESARIHFGSGIMYEYEKYNLPFGSVHPHKTNIWRSTNYINSDIYFNSNVRFYAIIYYQPDITSFVDYKMLGETGVTSSIAGNLSLLASFNFRYDNRPPDGIKHYDINSALGFNYFF